MFVLSSHAVGNTTKVFANFRASKIAAIENRLFVYLPLSFQIDAFTINFVNIR